MKSFSSREIIKILEQDGWFLLVPGEITTTSAQDKAGKITVPHLRKM